MITIPIPRSATVDAEALLRLELLFVERVVDLSAISDLVSQDISLKIHILQLAVTSTAPRSGLSFERARG